MIISLAILFFSIATLSSARLTHIRSTSPAFPRAIPGGFEIPFTRSLNRNRRANSKRGDVSGSIGLGDNSDLLYTVPIELDNQTTVVHLDTGSSDLWAISDLCTDGPCGNSVAPRLDSSQLNNSGARVTMYYGDSTTGTFATGPIAYSSATIAGVAIQNQAFVGVNATTNPVVQYGAAGIFGLGFPSGSVVQQSLTLFQHGSQNTTDAFVSGTYKNGPVLSRIVQTNALANPMFAISLQRDTIEIGGGTGTLTVGTLPPGIDNSSLTWVPVRLYSQAEGGLQPPSFAPNEVYPYRWEIDIDGVYLDGTKLPASTIPVLGGIDSRKTSALIDTGNSLLRGPADSVQNIINMVSTNPSDATLPCNVPHTLAFMIGGKMFPIDPRDFISQGPTPETVQGALQCTADNVVATDPPNVGALFRWSLGDPFLKSNLVAFHYGNLTHPSVDPPRIGILSMVPSDANAQLESAVSAAVSNGGVFESTLQIAPTALAAAEDETTVVPVSVNFAASTSTSTTSTPTTTKQAKATKFATSPSPIQTGTKSSGATGRTLLGFNLVTLVGVIGGFLML